MNLIKRITAVIAGVLLTLTFIPDRVAYAEGKAKDVRQISIDGAKANTKENMRYKGNGMVSGNNTSRLLMDYKAQSPEAYAELLEYLFGEGGLHISHLKLEMGSDINSSSGTEPAVMRYEDEVPDATRGAGYMLAHDAKEVNPDLTLDMLWWSEPKWVSEAEDKYKARYKWYKGTLDAAYEHYGLEFDYVSATQNERGYDSDWIKYLSKSLKEEKDCPYDYSKIKIVAGEEVCTWNGANELYEDKELMDAIDVMGSHYTSRSTEAAQKLAYEHGKELWFSEGCPPMEYAQGTYKYDQTKTGLNEINGMLDIANRFITMYPEGKMTLYEYQPAIAAYYSGATYTQKQLILADEPWSGYYMLDTGFFMGLHFSQFFKNGWAFIDDACYGDGQVGGDGHAIVDAHYTYMTAADPQTGDYSTAITNTTSEPITYEFTVEGLDKAGSQVYVWETRGPDSGSYDENYFKRIETLTPELSGGKYTYSVTVKPNSLVTVTTLDVERGEYEQKRSSVLPLPYGDDFEYDDSFLSERGGAPLYTTDQGGAFEVVTRDGSKVLMQKITKDIKANEWGSTPKPTTNFGDDRWYNYSVSAKVMLDTTEEKEKNYAGIGLRYNVADSGESGYRLVLFESGKWELLLNRTSLAEGQLDSFDPALNTLRIEALYGNVKAYINGTQVADLTAAEGEATGSAGRAALYSYYYNNCFDELSIEPLGDEPYIARYDETDAPFTYSGEWEHSCMSSFKNYKRTISTGAEGAGLELSFSGSGVILTGENKSGTDELIYTIDGGEERGLTVPRTASRGAFLLISGLDEGEHTLKLTVKSGSVSIDACEVLGQPAAKEADTISKQTADESSAPSKGGSSKAGLIALACGAAAVVAAGLIVRKRKKK